MRKPIFFSMAEEEDIQPNDISIKEDEVEPEDVNTVAPEDIEDGEDSGDVITDPEATDPPSREVEGNEKLPIFFSMAGDVQEGSKEGEDVQPNDIPVDEDKVEPEEVTEIDSPQEINDDKSGDVITEAEARGKLPIFYGMKG